jgi:Zn-dependent protease
VIILDLSPASLIANAIVLLVAVVVHEYAHAYGAYTQGDMTAYEQGRMTLDPRANVYWPGYLIGVLIGFAVMGSAPVNPYRMRNPRLGMFIAVGAGPLSNLLLAALFAVPFRFGLLDPGFETIGGILPTPSFLLTQMVYLNILLFVFNLLPLSPLDGWTVVLSLLPPRQAIWWERNRTNSMYVLGGLIIFSFLGSFLGPLAIINPMYWLVQQPTLFLFSLLTGA